MINQRPVYIQKYIFDWELLEVILSRKSALDAQSFLMPMTQNDQVNDFLSSYGYNQNDPVLKAELFGIFQEAVQFIKKYFLIEGSKDGLELQIPSQINSVSDVGTLFLMASGNFPDIDLEVCLFILRL